MKAPASLFALTIAFLTATATTAHSQDPSGTVKPLSAAPIPNIAGKSLKTAEVSYPPGGKSGPHHHAASAFIYAFVIEGEIRTQVEGEPAHVYHAGEFWTENPGAHHIVSENASTTSPARLLAVFVVDTTDTTLTTFDKH